MRSTRKRSRQKPHGSLVLPPHKAPRVDPSTDNPEASTTVLAHDRHPELLTNVGDQRLRISIDFGTANTCAAFVVLSSTDDGILDYVKNIEALHTRDEQIRFPTVMAILPTKEKGHATIAFAKGAIDALAYGRIGSDHMFQYPKLGWVDDLDGVVTDDQPVLKQIQSRHQVALNIASSFEKITVKYPGREKEDITLHKIDDVIVACLKYFLCLLKVSIAQELEVNDDQLNQIFEQKTEIGFAAPAFWSDGMLDRFLHQIQAAGYPSHCRIWSEPKCALAAHISLKLPTIQPTERDELCGQQHKAVLMVDVGSGTTDLASIRHKRMGDKTIEFESIAESSGSLCGGRLLDFEIERVVRVLLGDDLQVILESVSGTPGNSVGEDEFFQNLDFDECRKNFDGGEDVYMLRYRGNNLPSYRFDSMTRTAIMIPAEHMIAAHEAYTRRVIEHIEDQIAKTRAIMAHHEDLPIEVLLVGGQHFKSGENWDHVTVPKPAEDFHKPLVAIGCILSLGQPAIGRRFRVKEAYGIPIAKPFDSSLHSQASQARREDAFKGEEARDLIDWIRMIGEYSEKRVEMYDWSVALYNDDMTPYKKDPRFDATRYPLLIEQEIFSTTNRELGQRQHFEFKNHPEIKRRQNLAISLSQEECWEISSETIKGVGFYRNRLNGRCSFKVPVRITLQ